MLVLIGVLVCPGLMAQDKAKTKEEGPRPQERRGANYLIFPVETPLQHLLVYHLKAKTFVAVNGSGVPQGWRFNQGLLDSLHRDLDHRETKGDVVQFNIFFGENSGRLEGVKKLFADLSEVALDVGLEFDPANGVTQNSFMTWKEEIAAIDRDFPTGSTGDEIGLGDDKVMIYPVQTRLSRYLTGADAYVDFIDPLNGDPNADKPVLDMIRGNVAKLKLTRKRLLAFRLHASGYQGLNQDLKALAKSLGFDGVSVTIR
jgi:hypothetical protein